ncbi:MAG: DUF362 domain-containing protein [Candidatus Aminicenantes bacterium]|nr:DUF362 domain-containing protein [Candidatus Aminicenantes bacterium]
MKKIGRREFIRKSAKVGVFAALGSEYLAQKPTPIAYAHEGDLVDISVVKGADYFQVTRKAVAQLGGMQKFVPKGARVAILPNVQRWHPGTFTKPDIVRAVAQMCKQAGAKEVNCLSWLEMKNWEATGLAAVLKEEGVNLKLVLGDEAHFKPVKIPNGVSLDEAMIMKELYNNDVFIDIPITKDHAGNKFTGTMKNLMGINYRVNNRSNFHQPNWTTDVNAIRHLDQCIVDLNSVVKTHLCVIDATEFIITNGPMGPGEVIKPQTVIAGVDRVALDAYCTTLWDIQAEDIWAITHAHKRGLGNMNIKDLSVQTTKI